MAWKTLKSVTILGNKFFKIKKDRCRKKDGTIVESYYTVNRPDVVVIAAFTLKKQLILIEQYRHPVKSLDFELPAGYLEKKDAKIEKAAARELLEETGYKCPALKKIGEAYASAGFMSNTVHFYMGFKAQKIQKQKLDQSEELDVRITPWTKALGLLKQGKIKDLGSVAGILLAEKYLTKNA